MSYEHQTEIRAIPGGYEFYCHTCQYLARYTEEHGRRVLVIVAQGDVCARHTSGATDDEARLAPFEAFLRGKV